MSSSLTSPMKELSNHIFLIQQITSKTIIKMANKLLNVYDRIDTYR